jgi:Ca2+-binding EF-hand superfamily protein
MADYTSFLKDVEEVSLALSNTFISPRRAETVNVSKLLETLKGLFTQRRIKPRTLFPVDGTGRISKYTFERILTQTATVFTSDEVQAISNAFLTTASEVNYDDFVSYFDTAAPTPEDVTPVLDTIRDSLIEHRLQLRPELAKLARNTGDDISRTQLLVGLQNSSLVLGTPAIECLVREFPGSVPGTVSVSAICDAVDSPLPEPTPIVSPLPSGLPSPPRLPPAPAPVLDLVSRLGRSSQSLGIALENEFRRIDRLRHRRVTESQFRSVIGLLNARLSESDLRMVIAQYLLPDGFDYVSFCRDSALQPDELPPSDTEELLAVLRKCKALVASKMASIDVVFRPFDALGTGYVPVSSICKAFGDYGLILKPSEVALVAAAFHDRRPGDRINYGELQRKLQSISLPREKYQKTLFKAWTEEEYERVLSGVKTEVREKLHVRPRAFRRLLANVRQGTVTFKDFLQALDDSGLILKKEQIDALIQCYRKPGTETIDFIRFSQEIEKTNLLGVR